MQVSANSIHSSFYFSAFISIFVSGMYQTAYRNSSNTADGCIALVPIRTIPQEPRCRVLREQTARLKHSYQYTSVWETDALYEPANWTISTSISKEKVSSLLRMDDRDDWEATVTSVRCAAGSSRDNGRRGKGWGWERGKRISAMLAMKVTTKIVTLYIWGRIFAGQQERRKKRRWKKKEEESEEVKREEKKRRGTSKYYFDSH